MTMLWYWFKAAKLWAVSTFYWIDFDLSTFSLYKLSPKGGGRWRDVFTFFSFISLLGLCAGLIKKQLATAAPAFLDVNITDRAKAAAAVICRWVITFSPLPDVGRFTTATWPTGLQDKIKEMEKYKLCQQSN